LGNSGSIDTCARAAQKALARLVYIGDNASALDKGIEAFQSLGVIGEEVFTDTRIPLLGIVGIEILNIE
jgi:hypothetical protein